MMNFKKPSHADTMPYVEVKINVSVQVVLHKLVYGFAFVVWLLVSVWTS